MKSDAVLPLAVYLSETYLKEPLHEICGQQLPRLDQLETYKFPLWYGVLAATIPIETFRIILEDVWDCVIREWRSQNAGASVLPFEQQTELARRQPVVVNVSGSFNNGGNAGRAGNGGGRGRHSDRNRPTYHNQRHDRDTRSHYDGRGSNDHNSRSEIRNGTGSGENYLTDTVQSRHSSAVQGDGAYHSPHTRPDDNTMHYRPHHLDQSPNSYRGRGRIFSASRGRFSSRYNRDSGRGARS